MASERRTITTKSQNCFAKRDKQLIFFLWTKNLFSRARNQLLFLVFFPALLLKLVYVLQTVIIDLNVEQKNFIIYVRKTDQKYNMAHCNMAHSAALSLNLRKSKKFE